MRLTTALRLMSICLICLTVLLQAQPAFSAPLSLADPLALSPQERDWVAAHPVVPVLVVNTHIPLTFINQEGEQSGYAVALLNSIGRQTGLRFTWHPFNNLVEMREQIKKAPGSLIAAADASATGPDAGLIYTRPIQVTDWVLVTRKKFPVVTTLADMRGKKVAVFTGSYYLPELRRQFPQVEFVEQDFSLETALALFVHNLDGAIVPQTAASFVLKSYLEDRFRIAMTVPIPPLRLAMASGEQNRPLLSIIDKALERLPPHEMEEQLNGWQMRYALERFEVWGHYRTGIMSAIVIVILAAMLLVFYFWRNRLLRRTLATQQALQNELRASQAQLQKASESKSQFLAQMSHEIRTPMNALIGLLELENAGRSTPEQRRNNIAVAYESSKSLLMLVGDILDMAKIESGTFTVRSVPLSLREMINSVSTLFRYSAEEKHLALSASVEVQDDRILFDPVMLKQIVSNLVSNAIKFTAQGEVEIIIYQAKKQAAETGDYVLEVCDTGVGMSQEQQNAIFEPFVQLDAAQREHHGSGLGLSICRQLAALLHGSLEVESSPGEGTTFIFRFSAPVAPPPQVNTSKEVGQRGSRKILVVDDHPANRLLLVQQLEFAGHRSVAAENGVQALRLWEKENPPFDVVITDCNMPDLSGFELVRQLREKEKLMAREPQPMFGLTAMAEQHVRDRAILAGMTDCLFKPVELETLLARIDSPTEHAAEPASRPLLSLSRLAESQPEAFRALVDTVIEQNQLDMAALKNGITGGDFGLIKSSAHRLAGSARLADAPELSAVCGQIEAAAEAQDGVGVHTLATDCERRVKELENALRHVAILP